MAGSRLVLSLNVCPLQHPPYQPTSKLPDCVTELLFLFQEQYMCYCILEGLALVTSSYQNDWLFIY